MQATSAGSPPPPPPPLERTSASQLRRLAGKTAKQLSAADARPFAEALQGWTASELDAAVDGSGKTPLMAAAWRGSIANVEARRRA